MPLNNPTHDFPISDGRPWLHAIEASACGAVWQACGMSNAPAGQTPPPVGNPIPDDEVTRRRARIATAVSISKRIGYFCLLVSCVSVGIALFNDLPRGLITTAIISLAAACVILPLPIVLGYGVRAADREDRGIPRRH